MQRFLAKNIDKISSLCEMHKVRDLYAFGSVCTDRFNDSSDIDLLVTFKQMDHGDYAEAFFDLAESLEQLLQRPVDLLTEKSLKNPYFIESLNKTKTKIYGA